jgi:hypothetical protein
MGSLVAVVGWPILIPFTIKGVKTRVTVSGRSRDAK